MTKSKIMKNNKIRILIAIEIILLLISIVGIAMGNRTVITDQEMNISVLAGEYIEEKGYVIDQSYEYAGTYILSDEFELSPGVYELRVYYDKTGEDVSTTTVLNNNATFYGYRSSLSYIFRGDNAINKSQFYVLNKSDSFQVAVNVPGTDEMKVSAIEVVRTTEASRILLFVVLLGSMIVNGLVWIYFYLQEKEVSREVKVTWIAIPLITILASIPIFTDYTIVGIDTEFYLKRIEIIAHQLSLGSWSPKSIFLTIPALFRLIGFPMLFSYGMFIFLINFVSSIVSFVCTKKSFKNSYIAILGSAIYTLLPYRINLIYRDGDIGMLIELLVLPILVFLLVKLFQKNNMKNIMIIFLSTVVTLGIYILSYWNEGSILMFFAEEVQKITQINRMESWDTIKGIGVSLFVGNVIFLVLCFRQKKENFVSGKNYCVLGVLSVVLGMVAILLNFRLLGMIGFIVPTLLVTYLILKSYDKKTLNMYIITIFGMLIIFALYQTNSILLSTSNQNFLRGYTLDARQSMEQVENWFSKPFFFQTTLILSIFSLVALVVLLKDLFKRRKGI